MHYIYTKKMVTGRVNAIRITSVRIRDVLL
jgi:hypothetical protein